MSADSSSEAKFEIGHVVFIDIVGYSKVLLDEQKPGLRELTPQRSAFRETLSGT